MAAKTYNIIPLNKKKESLFKWSHDSMNEHRKSPEGFYGMVCGPTSDYIQIIDVDCKYDDSGKLWKEYSGLIHEQSLILKDKCSIQKTMNGGYHIIFKCKTLIGNTKLATAKNKKVLIETRGKGGYFVIAPSPGYEIIHGDPEMLDYLTEDEMNILLDTAKVFNEKIEPTKNRISKEIDISPLDDYNERGDALSLILSSGWVEVKEKGNAILLRRPDKNKGVSASWLIDRKLFYVFTSSTDFDNDKAYNQCQVYTILKHNGDFSLASKELLKKGFGTFKEKENLLSSKKELNTTECILSPEDGLDYIFDLKNNRIEHGLKFGFPSLDEHLRFKRNQYVMYLGNTNVGKTTTILYLLYKLNTVNGFNQRFLCLFAEDPVSRIKRNLIRYYTQKPIKSQTDEEIYKANTWINKHFRFIDANRRYSFVDLLKIADEVLLDWSFDALIIDPYNSLMLDEHLIKNIKGWDYHVNASNEFQLWAHTKSGIIISAHTVTSQQRLGSSSRPLLSHVEGGGMFSNKVDDGVVIHRIKDDENLRYETELHIEKIKDIDTGGMWTDTNNPVRLYMNEDGTGFTDSNLRLVITKKKEKSAPF